MILPSTITSIGCVCKGAIGRYHVAIMYVTKTMYMAHATIYNENYYLLKNVCSADFFYKLICFQWNIHQFGHSIEKAFGNYTMRKHCFHIFLCLCICFSVLHLNFTIRSSSLARRVSLLTFFFGRCFGLCRFVWALTKCYIRFVHRYVSIRPKITFNSIICANVWCSLSLWMCVCVLGFSDCSFLLLHPCTTLLC